MDRFIGLVQWFERDITNLLSDKFSSCRFENWLQCRLDGLFFPGDPEFPKIAYCVLMQGDVCYSVVINCGP